MSAVLLRRAEDAVLRGSRTAVLSVVLLGIALFSVMSSSFAHDTGFGHSRRTIFASADGEKVYLEYRVVMSPEEALVEMTLMDTDRDGKISAAERDNFFQAKAERLARGLHCKAGDSELKPQAEGYRIEQSLAQVYRYCLPTLHSSIILEDRCFPYKPGLVRVRAGAGLRIELSQPADLSHVDRVNLKLTRVPPPQPNE